MKVKKETLVRLCCVWSVSSHLGLQRQGLDEEGVSGTAIYGQKGGKMLQWSVSC
jgi:hypothetical protein